MTRYTRKRGGARTSKKSKKTAKSRFASLIKNPKASIRPGMKNVAMYQIIEEQIGKQSIKTHKNLKAIIKSIASRSGTVDPFVYLTRASKVIRKLNKAYENAEDAGNEDVAEKITIVAAFVAEEVCEVFNKNAALLRSSTDELADLFAGLAVNGNMKNEVSDAKYYEKLLNTETARTNPFVYLEDLRDFIKKINNMYNDFAEKTNAESRTDETKITMFAAFLEEALQMGFQSALKSIYKKRTVPDPVVDDLASLFEKL